MKEGQKQALLDNKPLQLAVAPIRLKDTLIAPLGPLASVCGATITQPKGQAIALTVKGS